MKRKSKIILGVITGMIFVFLGLYAIASWKISRTVVHQRPYPWDAYVLPDKSFSNTTIIDIAARINALIAQASKGSVSQAIILNTNSVEITEFPAEPAIKAEMDSLINAYRKDETNWLNRGACGFETFRFTGFFPGRHSLGCELQEMAEWAQLDYEEKPDAVHLGRKPAKLECHAYKISPKLKEMAETLKQKNQVRVDMEPATSAFVDVTRVSLWSIDVPTSPNDMTGEFRDASVFKYLPDKSILLVIETPEAHSTAEAKLKEQGLFDSQ